MEGLTGSSHKVSGEGSIKNGFYLLLLNASRLYFFTQNEFQTFILSHKCISLVKVCYGYTQYVSL